MKAMSILEKISKQIRDIRKLKKKSQEALAEKADLHPTLIGKIERGEINPTIVTLEKIAKAFDISLSQLLTFPNDKQITDADIQTLDQAIEILKQALHQAVKYKTGK